MKCCFLFQCKIGCTGCGYESHWEDLLVVSQDLGARKGVVVSTGGGAVMRDQNWRHMSQGIVIWLKGAPELLTKRALSDGTQSRPLLSQSSDQVCLGLSSMCCIWRAPKLASAGVLHAAVLH